MTSDPTEDLIADCTAILRRYARGYVAYDDERYDDLVQEGRITLWREHAALAAEPDADRLRFALFRAKRRMLALVSDKELITGLPEVTQRRAKGEAPVRLDAPVYGAPYGAETVGDLLAAPAALEAVEIGYHHGEIMAAYDALTPKQQAYVYARFWCGMDPSDGLHMVPGMREARAANPLLKRDILWTGSKTSPGAKARLAEALAHLRGLVDA